MCTLTWFTTDSGYELFFNRDERLTRSRAELPIVKNIDGVTLISPTDADAGGTWIAVNQFGITVCLLNHYQFQQIETYKDWHSRGDIVKKFAVISDLSLVKQWFDDLPMDNYRAFRMFIIEPQGGNRLCVWDGHSGRVERNVSMPKSSSSVDAKNVKAIRKGLFKDLNLVESRNSQDYINYHSSHLPSRSKDSVCMHRDDAKTVSLSHVCVDNLDISFRYADGSPCKAELGEKLTIDLLDAGISHAGLKGLDLAVNT